MSAQCAKLNTGVTGQKTCILRTDEMYDATWHHWAGKGEVCFHFYCYVIMPFTIPTAEISSFIRVLHFLQMF
jgi:hypothetical protein